MKVLVFTTVFPSAAQPLHGLFVAERVRRTARYADVRVVSPIVWFRRGGARRREHHESLAVEHPSFFYLPGLFKCLDGLFLFLSALYTVQALRRRFDFDLIDAHFGFPDGVAAVLLARWFRRPVTVTLRGSELELARFRLRAAAMRWALVRADRVIAVSQQLATLALVLGVSRHRVRIIENGVDTERFRLSDRAAARSQLGVDETATLIVSVGHLAPVKGFHLLLEALPALIAERPTLRFTIVGGPAAASGRYPARLASLIGRLGLNDRVSVTGPVSPHHVALWLSAADLFVLASEREGSPNAMREALACGCPVVACDVGDVRQVLPRHAGLIVADRENLEMWRQAVRSSLDERWNRSAICACAEGWTWTRVAERVVSQWSACLAPTTAGAPDCENSTEHELGDTA